MTKQYRRSLLTFYLSTPPAKGDRGQDFRTLPGVLEPTTDALVDALVRDIRARQEMVRSGLEDEDLEPLAFIGSKRIRDGVSVVAEDIQRVLGFDLVHFRRQRNPEDAFSELRELVERLGIFVLLIGNLGSHHSALEPEVFRGFALADSVAPFIVVNDQDAKAAWSFTLMHELVHLWLGETGISGGRPMDGVERFCNEVASELLLPDGELQREEWRLVAGSFDALSEAIAQFARPRNLSYTMVAFRLFRIGVIDQVTWDRCRQHFREMWRRQRVNARQLARDNDASGPSYYIVRRHRLGRALISFVRQQMEDGELSPTKAAKILGVKARSVAPLVREIEHAANGVGQ